jgi:ABC-type transport system involved in cytochrome c biogenesis permease subunit
MAIKWTFQGYLIYVAIAAFVLSAVLRAFRAGRTAETLGIAGFLASAAGVAYRWAHVEHVPLQSMFEVFLFLGAAVYPLSLFWRRFLDARAEIADALIAAVVLFPAGFVFSAEAQPLPPALRSWLFIPHVGAYMLAYVILFAAGAQAVRQIFASGENSPRFEQATYRLVKFAFPVLTLGLVLGSVWGKLAWGDYWNWDPKELWSLATWLVYLTYFHFRAIFRDKAPRINSGLALAGCAFVILTLLWVNLAARLFPGMHTYAT